MRKTVSYYFCRWNEDTGAGMVDLYDANDDLIGQIAAASPEQLSATHALLGISDETTFDTATKELYCGQAAAGHAM